MAKSYLGIDIGAGHLKMAVFEGETVSHIVTAEMPDNLIKDGRLMSYETMADIVRDTLKAKKITAKECSLALHSHDVYTRRITLPAMTAEELHLNLPFEFKDYIADGKDKFRFDYAVLNTLKNAQGVPEEMDILAVAAPIETINAYGSMLRKAGLKLKGAAPDIMAYANLIDGYLERTGAVAETNGEQTRPRDFCFLDIGTKNTRVYLFPQGEYEVTRSIEFGVASLESAIAEHFAVDPALGKTYLSTNYEGAQYIQPCLDRYEQLGVEVSRIISFFNFNYPESHLDTVHFCGSGSLVEPLLDTLEQHLSVDLVDIGTIMPPASVPFETLRTCPAAVGIALR